MHTFAIRRSFLAAFLLAPLLPAMAQDFPSRPVHIVVAVAPGGQTDILGRMLADGLSRKWGQPVIVDNRPGASGIVGSRFVAESRPDGYTLQIAAINTHGANPALFGKNLPYDPVRDFTALTQAVATTNVLVVNAQSPFHSVRDLLAYAKAHPGNLTYGSAGAGTSLHLFMEMLKAKAGVDIRHVPYKGSGPAMADLLGGRITMMFDSMPSAWPQVQAGRLRALAVSTGKRSATAPQVPTMQEAGVADFDYASWLGVVAPAHLPAELVARLGRDIDAVLAQPEVREKLAGMGMAVVADSPSAFASFIQQQVRTWGRVVKASDMNAK